MDPRFWFCPPLIAAMAAEFSIGEEKAKVNKKEWVSGVRVRKA
jgi:hypothetical protein